MVSQPPIESTKFMKPSIRLKTPSTAFSKSISETALEIFSNMASSLWVIRSLLATTQSWILFTIVSITGASDAPMVADTPSKTWENLLIVSVKWAESAAILSFITMPSFSASLPISSSPEAPLSRTGISCLAKSSPTAAVKILSLTAGDSLFLTACARLRITSAASRIFPLESFRETPNRLKIAASSLFSPLAAFPML